MKTIKDIIELYKPKSADEDRFVKKHVIKKTEDANGNKDDVFNATNVKPTERTPKHGYNPGEDEQVYEGYEEIRFDDPENNSKPSGSTRDSRSRSERIDAEMNKLGNQYGRKNLASKIKKKYSLKNEETVSEDTHTDHFRFLLPLQKAGVPAPSKERAMDLVAKHGDPLRAGQAYVDRYKKIKNAANKVQKEEIELDEDLKQQGLWKLITDHEKQAKKTKNTIKQNHHLAMADRYRGQLKTNVDDSPKVQEETELDEARTKKSPIEKLFNRPSMQFAKKYTDKDKLTRLGFPERHLPKDASLGFTDTGTTSSLEGKAKQGKIEDVVKRTMQTNSYESDNELVLNPFLRGLLEATCKECGKTYKKGGSCSCCMKEDVQIDEVLTPSMGAGAYIDDFVNSKDPKFVGKSKEKRRQMALAAYYAAKRGK
jgi:hypothetical protein